MLIRRGLCSCFIELPYVSFFSIAAKKRYVIDEYIDDAEGVFELNEHNKESMTKVILRPKVTL